MFPTLPSRLNLLVGRVCVPLQILSPTSSGTEPDTMTLVAGGYTTDWVRLGSMRGEKASWSLRPPLHPKDSRPEGSFMLSTDKA